jgi:YVTN family beta-propeller protein
MKALVEMRRLWMRARGIGVFARAILNQSSLILGVFLVLLTSDRAQAASYVYAGKTDNSVVVIGTATNTEIATVQVGQEPSGIAVTPDGAFVYVVNRTSQTISVIDTQTNTVVATLAMSEVPSEIVINPNGSFAYVTLAPPPEGPFRGSIAVIDTSNNTVITKIPLGEADSGPQDMAVSPDGQFLYVATSGASTVANVFFISTITNTVVDVIPSSIVQRIAVTPDGAFAYLTELEVEGNVLVLDISSRTIVATINVRDPGTGGHPSGVAISPDGAFAYVTVADDLKII